MIPNQQAEAVAVEPVRSQLPAGNGPGPDAALFGIIGAAGVALSSL